MPDDLAATQIIAELLARLIAHPAPAGIRGLGEVAQRMIDDGPARRGTGPIRPSGSCSIGWAAAVGDVLGLDRDRACAWTLGRVLQNSLWEIEDGADKLDPAQVVIAAAVGKRAS